MSKQIYAFIFWTLFFIIVAGILVNLPVMFQ